MLLKPQNIKAELLLPNQWCKNAYNAHRAYGSNLQWHTPKGMVYADLMPSIMKQPFNQWIYLKKFAQKSHLTKLNIQECHMQMQQWLHRLLNLQASPDDHALFLKLNETCGLHPALYPYWLYHERPALPELVIFPYQWQKIELALFSHYEFKLAATDLVHQDPNQLLHESPSISHDECTAISGNMMLMVPNITPYWLYFQEKHLLGCYHRYALKDQVIITTLLKSLNALDAPRTPITTHVFKDQVTTFINDTLHNQSLTAISHHAINQLRQHLNDFIDDDTKHFTAHLADFEYWIQAQTANFHQTGTTMLVSQPHAHPMFFDRLLLVNEPYATEPMLTFKPKQWIHKLDYTHHNNTTPVYPKPTKYDQLPLPKRMRVTQFQQFQRCPIVHACQHHLNVNTIQPPCTKRDLGILIHEALAHIWSKLKNQATLLSSSSTWLHGLIDEALNEQINKQIIHHDWEKDFWHYQLTHMHELLYQWLLLESKRSPFSVLAIECPITIHHQGIEMHGRIDRIDDIEGLGAVLIDYKTGQTASMQQMLDGFPDPQMLAYTCHPKYDIQGIAYGLIYQQALKGVQFCDSDEPIGPVVQKPDALAVLTNHINQIQSPLTGNPQTPRICQTCDFQSICLQAGAFK